MYKKYRNSDGTFGRMYEGRNGEMHFENSDGTFGTIHKGRNGNMNFTKSDGTFGTIYKGRNGNAHFENNKGGFGTIYNSGLNNQSKSTPSYTKPNTRNISSSANIGYNHDDGYSGNYSYSGSHSYKQSHIGGLAEYSFGNFVIHIIIAAVTGLIGGAITDSLALGITFGIASFALCTLIHLIIKGDISDYDARKSTINKIILYIVSIAACIGLPAVYYGHFSELPATVAMLATWGLVFLIAKKLDDIV